jgi:hypothetical protein
LKREEGRFPKLIKNWMLRPKITEYIIFFSPHPSM